MSACTTRTLDPLGSRCTHPRWTCWVCVVVVCTLGSLAMTEPSQQIQRTTTVDSWSQEAATVHNYSNEEPSLTAVDFNGTSTAVLNMLWMVSEIFPVGLPSGANGHTFDDGGSVISIDKNIKVHSIPIYRILNPTILPANITLSFSFLPQYPGKYTIFSFGNPSNRSTNYFAFEIDLLSNKLLFILLRNDRLGLASRTIIRVNKPKNKHWIDMAISITKSNVTIRQSCNSKESLITAGLPDAADELRFTNEQSFYLLQNPSGMDITTSPHFTGKIERLMLTRSTDTFNVLCMMDSYDKSLPAEKKEGVVENDENGSGETDDTEHRTSSTHGSFFTQTTQKPIKEHQTSSMHGPFLTHTTQKPTKEHRLSSTPSSFFTQTTQKPTQEQRSLSTHSLFLTQTTEKPIKELRSSPTHSSFSAQTTTKPIKDGKDTNTEKNTCNNYKVTRYKNGTNIIFIGDTKLVIASGPKGQKGEVGLQGEKGGLGAEGSSGKKGEKGTIGAEGSPGQKGDKGTIGAEGSPGQKGDKGTIGAEGSPGQKGDKGTIGAEGSPGQKGDRGTIGAKGSPGQKGDRGDQGEKGVTGKPGERGKNCQCKEASSQFENIDNRIREMRKSLMKEVNEKMQKVFKVIDETIGSKCAQLKRGRPGSQGRIGPQGPQGRPGPPGYGFERIHAYGNGVVVYKSKADLEAMSDHHLLGTLAYVREQKRLYIKVDTMDNKWNVVQMKQHTEDTFKNAGIVNDEPQNDDQTNGTIYKDEAFYLVISDERMQGDLHNAKCGRYDRSLIAAKSYCYRQGKKTFGNGGILMVPFIATMRKPLKRFFNEKTRKVAIKNVKEHLLWDSVQDLFDGSPIHTSNKLMTFEAKDPVDVRPHDTSVWTGASKTGSNFDMGNCNGWTSSAGRNRGHAVKLDAYFRGTRYFLKSNPRSCSAPKHILCISAKPHRYRHAYHT